VIENPNNPQHRERAPLILIHDGGGTIFNYYMIGMLGRPVYGIPDPRFGTESPWEDGIPQMARCYSDLIRSNIRSRQVLLGGACQARRRRDVVLTSHRMVTWGTNRSGDCSFTRRKF